MRSDVVARLGNVFLFVDANLPEGITRDNLVAVLQELGFTNVTTAFLDSVFAKPVGPGSLQPPPQRVRPEPYYEPGELPALDNAEREALKKQLRLQPRQQQDEHALLLGGAVGIDTFIDAVAALRDESAATGGGSCGPASDEALLQRLQQSPHLATLSQPSEPGVNGRLPFHVETWRFLVADLVKMIPDKGGAQFDLRGGAKGGAGDGGGVFGAVSGSAAAAAGAAESASEMVSPAAQQQQQQQQQQQKQQQQQGGGGGLIVIPDFADDGPGASELQMIELELQTVRSSLQRVGSNSTYKRRLEQQEKKLVEELERERVKAGKAV
jgi:hypothetical protein